MINYTLDTYKSPRDLNKGDLIAWIVDGQIIELDRLEGLDNKGYGIWSTVMDSHESTRASSSSGKWYVYTEVTNICKIGQI